jgi:hypothetical protein
MSDTSPLQNQLLAALPADIYQRLQPHIEKGTLKLKEVLYEPGDPITSVYFPYKGLLSLVSKMRNIRSMEVGMVGNEGMVGTAQAASP